MAKSKSEDFTSNFVHLAAIAKALSHPARVQIIKILTEKNSCICGDIVNLLPLAQSTVSQHLKELKRAGLIQGEIEGPKTCYCINYTNLEKAGELIKNMFDQFIKKEYCKCKAKKK